VSGLFSPFYEKDTPTSAFPFFPPRTLFLNAGYQVRIKIRLQVIVNYRIFLAAPVSFHDTGSALVLKELYRVWGEIEDKLKIKLEKYILV
jgi:hypothetical protein